MNQKQKKHLITLVRKDGGWYSINSDPKVIDLFGTPIIATPYSSSVPEWEIQRIIQKLNPDQIVMVSPR